jgi:hypothetical protein
MKLVEILARELKEWPVKAKGYTQDGNGKIYPCTGLNVSFNGNFWTSQGLYGLHGLEFNSQLATDHTTAIVTRSDWEAERAKLKATKANGDGWIRHRGGKCQVAAGTLVDVRYRSGKVNEHVKALVDSYMSGSMQTHNAVAWTHIGSANDIMAYRIHKPAEQPAPVSEEAIQVGIDAADAGKLTPIDEVKARILSRKTAPAEQSAPVSEPESELLYDPVAQGPLQWRDRIRELDTQHAEVEATYQCQVSEITKERESLVQKLAGEGLALAEDMSDWRNWKAGDLVEWIGLSSQHYTLGKTYEVEKVLDKGLVMDDNNGGDHRWGGDQEIARAFKWHSRPAS